MSRKINKRMKWNRRKLTMLFIDPGYISMYGIGWSLGYIIL